MSEPDPLTVAPPLPPGLALFLDLLSDGHASERTPRGSQRVLRVQDREEVADTLKEEPTTAVAALQRSPHRGVMMSGDKKPVARAISGIWRAAQRRVGTTGPLCELDLLTQHSPADADTLQAITASARNFQLLR
jgi:hypothetical protein